MSRTPGGSQNSDQHQADQEAAHAGKRNLALQEGAEEAGRDKPQDLRPLCRLEFKANSQEKAMRLRMMRQRLTYGSREAGASIFSEDFLPGNQGYLRKKFLKSKHF
jgi:hypothetical protein